MGQNWTYNSLTTTLRTWPGARMPTMRSQICSTRLAPKSFYNKSAQNWFSAINLASQWKPQMIRVSKYTAVSRTQKLQACAKQIVEEEKVPRIHWAQPHRGPDWNRQAAIAAKWNKSQTPKHLWDLDCSHSICAVLIPLRKLGWIYFMTKAKLEFPSSFFVRMNTIMIYNKP